MVMAEKAAAVSAVVAEELVPTLFAEYAKRMDDVLAASGRLYALADAFRANGDLKSVERIVSGINSVRENAGTPTPHDWAHDLWNRLQNDPTHKID
jgi:hypothetical protein